MGQINEDMTVAGTLTVDQLLFRTGGTRLARSTLAQETSIAYVMPVTTWRVWDSLTTPLPQVAAADDLAIIEGTFGTDFPTIQTSDAKATTVTQMMRRTFVLPAEFDDEQTVQVRIKAGMITTVSDGTATVDVECHLHDRTGAVGSDLCTTAATTINSLTAADKTFNITSTGLSPGDELDIRVTVAITDTATGTVVVGEIVDTTVLLDIRG